MQRVTSGGGKWHCYLSCQPCQNRNHHWILKDFMHDGDTQKLSNVSRQFKGNQRFCSSESVQEIRLPELNGPVFTWKYFYLSTKILGSLLKKWTEHGYSNCQSSKKNTLIQLVHQVRGEIITKSWLSGSF